MKLTIALLVAAAASAVTGRHVSVADKILHELARLHLPSLSTVARPIETETPVLGAFSANQTPVVMMHGLGDAGSNPGMQSLAATVSNAYPGKVSVAVDVADGLMSFITPMQAQVDQFAAAVRADARFKNGFHLVGLSQGGLVARAYVEQYNDPPVRNLVTVSGVMNGVFNCPLELQIIPFVCQLFETDPYALNGILGFSEYFVLSQNRSLYLEGNPFLPPLNGQVVANATFKSRFASLDRLVLGMALNDTVVYPKESEQFGGYEWGTKDTVFTMRQAGFYANDTFGLRTLDEAGKVSLVQYEGDHLRFTDDWWNANILPVLGG